MIAVAAMLAGGCGGAGDAPDDGKASDGRPSAAAASQGGPPRGPGRRGPGGGPRAEPPVPVVLAAVESGTMRAFLDASATLEAEDGVEVVSQATGVVVEVLVEEGDRVRAGQLLARLAYEDLELAEARARSEYDRSLSEHARAERLMQDDLISEEDFQKTEFDLARAEIDWKSADLALRRTRILAPIGGTVTARETQVGQLVRDNDTMYRVVDFGSLIAPVFVPEKHLPDLRVGQAARLTAPGIGDRTVEARIRRISPTVDGQSGTVRVVVGLPRLEGLRPGMFATVQIELDRHEDVPVIPKKALVFDDERPFVFHVEDGVARKREIELGYSDEERAEVLRGVGIGDVIVLVGQSTLKDGNAVRAEGARDEASAVPAAPLADGADRRRARRAAARAGAGS